MTTGAPGERDDIDDDPTTVPGLRGGGGADDEAEERTVLVERTIDRAGANKVVVDADDEVDADERTIIVAAPVGGADDGVEDDDEDDERTTIVDAPGRVGEVDGDEDERTTIVDSIADDDDDERTTIVDSTIADDDDERTTIVDAEGVDVDSDERTIIVGEDQGDPESAELGELDEHSIRRVVRARRLEREPLAPRMVPPGRNGPVLPGAGAGAVFTSEVRPVPAAISVADRPTAPAGPRLAVPSVADASRRTSVAALVTVSASVLVTIVGLVWVVRELFGA